MPDKEWEPHKDNIEPQIELRVFRMARKIKRRSPGNAFLHDTGHGKRKRTDILALLDLDKDKRPSPPDDQIDFGESRSGFRFKILFQ